MSVHFEPVWSWALTLLACLAMLGVMWLAYPRRTDLPAGWQRILIWIATLAILVLLVLLLLRPVAVFESNDKSEAILFLYPE